MNIHKNARLTPLRREEMAVAVIESAGCCPLWSICEDRVTLDKPVQGIGPRGDGGSPNNDSAA